jgi:hypothetical protein
LLALVGERNVVNLHNFMVIGLNWVKSVAIVRREGYRTIWASRCKDLPCVKNLSLKSSLQLWLQEIALMELPWRLVWEVLISLYGSGSSIWWAKIIYSRWNMDSLH